MDPYAIQHSGMLEAVLPAHKARLDLPFSNSNGATSFSSILHVDGNHWVAFSIHPYSSAIWIWDSLYSGLQRDIGSQLGHLGNHIVEHIRGFHAELQWEFVQCTSDKQPNTPDCGVSALQNLVDFIRRGKLREHLNAAFLRFAYAERLLGVTESRPREVEEGEEYPVWSSHPMLVPSSRSLSIFTRTSVERYMPC
jgi:hypothetical protein